MKFSPRFYCPFVPRAAVPPSVSSQPHTHFPSKQFDIECSGIPNPTSIISSVPQFEELRNNIGQFDTPEELWNSSTHTLLQQVGNHSSYFTLLELVRQHGLRTLFIDAFCAPDAPLPHLLYEDFVQVLTFCTDQFPPDEQTLLNPDLTRAILCRAAEWIAEDFEYFPRVEQLYETMQQQQNIDEGAGSAWVACLCAAGRPLEALDALNLMQDAHLHFDPLVFALMMQPAVSILNIMAGREGRQAGIASVGGQPIYTTIYNPAGMLRQMRLHRMLDNEHPGAASSGLHVVLTSLALDTSQTTPLALTLFSETVHHAVINNFGFSTRTLDMIREIFLHALNRQPKFASALSSGGCRAFIKVLTDSGQVRELTEFVQEARAKLDEREAELLPVLAKPYKQSTRMQQRAEMDIKGLMHEPLERIHLLQRALNFSEEEADELFRVCRVNNPGETANLFGIAHPFLPLKDHQETLLLNKAPSDVMANTTTTTTITSSTRQEDSTGSEFSVNDNKPSTNFKDALKSLPPSSLVDQAITAITPNRSIQRQQASSSQASSLTTLSTEEEWGIQSLPDSPFASISLPQPPAGMVRVLPYRSPAESRRSSEAVASCDVDFIASTLFHQSTAEALTATSQKQRQLQDYDIAWWNPESLL